MTLYAPLGASWMDFHADRITNALEFLILNGWDTFGFTVWSVCSDCLLESSWSEGVTSHHAINFWPFLVMYFFGGIEYVLLFGPSFDKLIIFISAVLMAELIIKSTKNLSNLPDFFIGIGCFALFAISPWTYKMLLGGWWEAYFLMFFLAAMLLFENKKFKLGLVSFFLAATMHYLWALVLLIFYILLTISPLLIKNETSSIDRFFPPNTITFKTRLNVMLFIGIPVFGIIFSQLITSSYIDFGTNSSIFYRMGISGNDAHNGGLIGALQFLAGSRFTQCFGGQGMEFLSGNSLAMIGVYNCLFSLIGMTFLSLLSLVGIYFLIKNSQLAMKVLLPLIFCLLFFITVFQQSLSVHLMGYSFIFSALFAAGIIYMMLMVQTQISSPILGFIFSIPCISGILVLSIRVSMLSGMS
jgi:hypothetical protein